MILRTQKNLLGIQDCFSLTEEVITIIALIPTECQPAMYLRIAVNSLWMRTLLHKDTVIFSSLYSPP